MVSWNLGKDRPLDELGLIGLSIWVLGFLAWPMLRRWGGPRPALRVGALFAAVYALNHFVAHPGLSSLLGPASAVLWLWLLPTLVTALGRGGAGSAVGVGLFLGLAAQVALQAALHGMDLSMLRGLWPGLGAAVLAGALVWFLRSGTAAQALLAGGAGDGLPGWGFAALGPFLVLQLTLLVNVGRVQVQAGWELPAASLVILLGLAAAVAVQCWSPPYPVRLAAAALAVALVAQPGLLKDAGVLLLVPVQAALGVTMASALASPAAGSSAGSARHTGQVFGWTIVGAMALLALVYLFYASSEWQGLWPIAAGLAVLPALVPGAAAGRGETARGSVTARLRLLEAQCRPTMVGVLILAVVGLATGLTGRGDPAATGPAPTELKVLNYNIHQGFDFHGVPAPEGIARFIEQTDADIVGLQEVGRGWNVNGGVDLMAWLEWRLPEYHAVYGPMNGDLWGNAILSRYPIAAWGWMHYPVRASSFERGLTWANIPTVRGDQLVVTTHFSAHAGYDEDRIGQAGDLLAFWGGRPRSVIVGDINARPGEDAVRRLIVGGLVDVPAAHGLGETPTFASGNPYQRIDYVFTSPDVRSVSAAVPHTLASDHLPVMATVRIDEAASRSIPRGLDSARTGSLRPIAGSRRSSSGFRPLDGTADRANGRMQPPQVTMRGGSGASSGPAAAGEPHSCWCAAGGSGGPSKGGS